MGQRAAAIDPNLVAGVVLVVVVVVALPRRKVGCC